MVGSLLGRPSSSPTSWWPCLRLRRPLLRRARRRWSPIAGSAYTYTYVTLGEIVAWIIGWDLILEYAVGNVAVAVSWADYFKTLLAGFGLHLPAWLLHDAQPCARDTGPP